MDQEQQLKMICEMVGYYEKISYPLEFRLAAGAIIAMALVVIVSYLQDVVG